MFGDFADRKWLGGLPFGINTVHHIRGVASGAADGVANILLKIRKRERMRKKKRRENRKKEKKGKIKKSVKKSISDFVLIIIQHESLELLGVLPLGPPPGALTLDPTGALKQAPGPHTVRCCARYAHFAYIMAAPISTTLLCPCTTWLQIAIFFLTTIII